MQHRSDRESVVCLLGHSKPRAVKFDNQCPASYDVLLNGQASNEPPLPTLPRIMLKTVQKIGSSKIHRVGLVFEVQDGSCEGSRENLRMAPLIRMDP